MFSPLISLISSVGFSTFSITGLVQAIPRLPDVFGPIPSVTLDKDLIQFSQLLFNYTRKWVVVNIFLSTVFIFYFLIPFFVLGTEKTLKTAINPKHHKVDKYNDKHAPKHERNRNCRRFLNMQI